MTSIADSKRKPPNVESVLTLSKTVKGLNDIY